MLESVLLDEGMEGQRYYRVLLQKGGVEYMLSRAMSKRSFIALIVFVTKGLSIGKIFFSSSRCLIGPLTRFASRSEDALGDIEIKKVDFLRRNSEDFIQIIVPE
jgi:hypothetical protein